jgi:hypothetical protein
MADELSERFNADLDQGLEILKVVRALPPELLESKRHLRGNLAEGSEPIPKVHMEALRPFRFTQITWISKDGMQFRKWARGDPPPMFSVEDREYYRAIRDGRGWGGREHPFFVESVRSRSTGQVLAVFSAPMNVPGQAKDAPREVVAVGMRPASVIDPVLPAGFGFAVIDADGRVVFGSQPDRALEENYFEECLQPRRLRAAVQSRARDAIDVRYWGRDHAVVTTPLADTPWSLLVFFRKDQLRAAHFQALSVSATFLLAIVVLVAVYAGVARALTSEGADTWFWPRDGTEHRLTLAATLLLTLGGLFAGLANAPDPGIRLAAAVCLPLAAVGAVVGLLGVGSPTAWRAGAVGAVLYAVPLAALVVLPGGSPLVVMAAAAGLLLGVAAYVTSRVTTRGSLAMPGLRTAYTVFTLSALWCCSAVPSALLFRSTWDLEMDHYLRSMQLDLALRAGSTSPKHAATSSGDDRLVLSKPVNTAIEPWARPIPKAGGCPRSPLDDLLAFTRGFEYPASRMPVVSGRLGCDRSWQATVLGDERHVTVVPPLVRAPMTVRTDALPFEAYGRWVTWASLGVLGFAALGLIRLLLRRSFLLHFSEAHTVSLHELATMPLPANLFVLTPSFANLERLQQRPGLRLVSLAGRSAADLRLLRLSLQGGGVVCLQGFEHAGNDPEMAAALLDWLEDVTATRADAVLIVSEREPESVLRLPAGHEVQAQARRFVDRPESRRWERVLGRFVRVVARDPGDPTRFLADLESAQDDLQARTPATGHAALGRLYATVRTECLEHGPLQAVGLTVVRMPDFAGHDPYRLVRHIRELGDRFYRAVWSALTDKEKLLLTQVANGNLINPQNRRALNRLLALRLVVKRSRFELVNQSFGEFVLAAVTPEDLAEWQRSCHTSTWAVVRAPAFVTLACIGVFLAYTQRSFLPAALGIVGTSVPLLVKLLDLVRGLQGQTKPAQ